MTEPLEAISTPTAPTTALETTIAKTVVLYTAQDAQGRLFLTDDQNLLPPDVQGYCELTLAPAQVTWAMLRVEVEELRGIPVTIQVGGYRYETPKRNTALPPTAAAGTGKGAR